MYRCLHSKGWQIVFFNAQIGASDLVCGLAFFGAHLPRFPIALFDVDTGISVCRVQVPEDLQDQPSKMWFHDPLDSLEIEVLA
jgi:hypothetical protein